MKIESVREIMGDTVYLCKAEKVTTEDDCYKLALFVSGIGEVKIIDCTGYSDMDTHENEAWFNSTEEFEKGIEEIKGFGCDYVVIRFGYGGQNMSFHLNIGDYKDGATFSVSSEDEEVTKKVLGAIKKKFG